MCLRKFIFIILFTVFFNHAYAYKVHPMAYDFFIEDKKPKKLYITNTSKDKNLYMEIKLLKITNNGFPAKSVNSRIRTETDALLYLTKNFTTSTNSKDKLLGEVMQLVAALGILKSNLESKNNFEQYKIETIRALKKIQKNIQIVLENKQQITSDVARNIKSIQAKTAALQTMLLQQPLKEEMLYQEEHLTLNEMLKQVLISPSKVKIGPGKKQEITLYNRLSLTSDQSDRHYRIYLKAIKGELISKKKKLKEGTMSVDVGVNVNYTLPVLIRTNNPKFLLGYNYDDGTNLLTLINKGNTTITLKNATYCAATCSNKVQALTGKFYANNKRFLLVDDEYIGQKIVIDYAENNVSKSMEIKL